MAYGLGLERGIVRVVPYNPEWPQYFQAERELLHKSLGPKVLEIRHIGSTAIRCRGNAGDRN